MACRFICEIKGKKEELCYQLVDAYGDCIEAVAEVKHVEHFDCHSAAMLLQNYIGRVEKNAMQSTRTGKQLRKTRIQDDMGREVEITLWPEACHLIRDDVVPGDIVVIGSTTVSEHKELPETSYASHK
ncbi:hypothetical protein CASFOL_026254 [Castilleja foliolosa]|uniref:Uncharacterized protein n=1 Tax=Castilleja foliolosa TaxID=1961234 RepID=A0ABD3CMX3_9LAMI